MLKLRPFVATLGVGLGSFTLNFGVSTGNYSDLNLTALSLSLLIGLGAMLQASAGAFIFKHKIGNRYLVDAPGHVTRFIVWVAPLSCLIAASVGSASLWYHGFISEKNVSFTWLTWWVGDMIGVLLFTPLFLILSSQETSLTRNRKALTTIPTLIIFTGVLLFFFASLNSHQSYINQEIEENAQRLIQKLEERLAISENKLRSYVAFYRGSDSVTRTEFERFSKSLLEEGDAVYGVGWIEPVLDEQREQVERDLGQGRFFTQFGSGTELIRAETRDVYYPVLLIYPYAKNEKAYGFDLGSRPDRLSALKLAKAIGKPVATEPLRLAQESENSRAIITYYPLTNYVGTFTGYISGVFRMDNLFDPVVTQSGQDYGIRVTDVTDSNNRVPLFTSRFEPFETFGSIKHRMSFAERQYEFEVIPTQNFSLVSKDWTSWIILTSGFLIAAMLQSFILILTGATEHTRQEVIRKTEDLNHAKHAAEAANHAKSNFLANMSHEFRTPLNAIIGLINLCLKTSMTEKQFDYLRKAKLASGTLLSLINHTLDYSKIEAGKLELEKTEFGLQDIVRKLSAIFSSQAQDQGLSFDLLIPESMPGTLIGDPLRVEQILLNLCSNAFKFTKKGGVQLKIEIVQQNQDYVQFEFSVTDTGIGIALEQQEHLFKSFTQADSSMSRKFGGTGLGLAISKELAQLMDGDITLSSIAGEGSRFSVSLRFALSSQCGSISSEDVLSGSEHKSGDEDVALWQDLGENPLQPPVESASVVPEQRGSEDRVSLDNRTILVVEDIEVNQLIAEEILCDYGAHVVLASNGLDALQVFQRNPELDCILMDVQMPEMDGLEATREIRKLANGSDIPIIAMTANAMASDIVACENAGMDDHIAKPIDEEAMLTAISKHLLRYDEMSS
ncbi:sensor protein [Oleiphilus messinensis]|uniref:histidine kinase n=1 Tax=Oleiphilus messinensis TaxID=141451 RepID=A0A1Y0IBC5_9GAMM|nr:sensor protein [Oleiphilus messinensis]